MKTKITDILGTKYPFIQGGMAWIATAELAAAVSNAGGLGLLGSGSAPAGIMREEIKKVKALTDKPFGMNIMLMNPYADELAQLCIDEKVPVVTTGAGTPAKYIPAWKEAGIKVIPVVPSVALAKRVERYGADAVIAEGTEAGGHIGEITTMCLVPQIVDAVDIPVIAAGGIADGRGVAAALMLGADGVQMGTVFLASPECNIHQTYKNLVIKAKDLDTIVTGRDNGHPVRSLKNKFTRKIATMEKVEASFQEIELATLGSFRKAVQNGDTEEGTFMSGQIAGLIKEEKSVQRILDDIADETKNTLNNFRQERGIDIG